MCGISGAVTAKRAAAEDAVRRMNVAQAHRGPDDSGVEVLALAGGHLALGHRRLSIIDLSSAGRQPMKNLETGDWIVFNGEIYNFPELRRQLQSRGARFRTGTDTEVILEAYKIWGAECFSRFRGMFALAIYDAPARRLVLARDHLGIKPLYVSRTAEAFAFASEVRALCAGRLVGREIDARGLAGLLAYGAVAEPLTIMKNVRMLEAGTYCVLDVSIDKPWTGRLETHRYWDFPKSRNRADIEDTKEQLRHRLAESVRSHLISDVPVGVFLSSGIDSNAITALAQEYRRGDLDAFTITLAGNPALNEGNIASSVAKDLGLRYHQVELSTEEVQRQAQAFLDRGIDQPSVDGLNTYIISRAVRQRGIVVALSGLGGDEVFGGYSTFRDVPRLARLHQATCWIPRSIREQASAWMFRHASPARRYKAAELATKPGCVRSFCLRRRRLLADIELAALGFRASELDLDEDFLPFESEPDRGLSNHDAGASISILESRFYMGNMLLRDADVFGMRHGLEIRVPLLDRRVVDLAYALPGPVRVRRAGPNKPVLVQALEGRLRPELLNLKKRGFHLPISEWMRGALREQVVASLESLTSSGTFNPESVNAIWAAFLRHPNGPDWSRVWLMCVLGRWMQTLTDNSLAASAA